MISSLLGSASAWQASVTVAARHWPTAPSLKYEVIRFSELPSPESWGSESPFQRPTVLLLLPGFLPDAN